MPSHSQLIRQPRLQKGITQRALSSGICSRSTLAMFEKSGTYLSADFLFEFLDRMNIDPTEYQYRMTGKNQPKKEIFKKIELYFNNGDSESLIELYKHTHNIYRDTQDSFYLLAAFKSINFHLDLTNNNQPHSTLQIAREDLCLKLKTYLLKREEWGTFEAEVFCELIPFLTSDQLRTGINSLIKRATLAYRPTRITLLKNLLRLEITFLKNEQLSRIDDLADSFNHLLTEEDLHWRICIRFLHDIGTALREHRNQQIDFSYLNIYKEMGYDRFHKLLIQYHQQFTA